MKIAGIYKIQSTINPKKIYIGSSANVYKRWASHLQLLRKGKHKNQRIQNHCNKYGFYDLHFSLLITCETIDLIQNEQFFIDAYKPWFNLRKVADRCTGCHWKLSDETKRKMSIATMGHKRNVGHKRSEEFKKALSQKLKGRKLSDDTIQKLSIAGKKRRHPDEVKKKISASLMGREVSEKNRQRVIMYNRTRIISNETKKKISDSLKQYNKLKQFKLISQN